MKSRTGAWRCIWTALWDELTILGQQLTLGTQTCGKWHQNVSQRFARTRRVTFCLNPGNWDMIFLLQQTLSAVLWSPIPGTLHTGTSQADLEAIVKKSLYIMAWRGEKGRYNMLHGIKWKFKEFIFKRIHSQSPYIPQQLRPEFWTSIQKAQPFTINTTKAHVLQTIIVDDVPIFCLRNAQNALNKTKKWLKHSAKFLDVSKLLE